jgi:hypothetical protein
MQLRRAISHDLGALLPKLRKLGYEPVKADYSWWHFGNYSVEFRAGEKSFRIVRDRLQHYVASDTEDFQGTELFRAFDHLTEFEQALLPWLGAV